MPLPLQAETVRLSTGQQFVYGGPDPDLSRSTTPTAVVHEAFNALELGMERIAAVKADRLLSQVGQAAKAEGYADSVLAAMFGAQQRLADLGRDIETAEAKFYAVPALEPHDAVGFLAGAEIRNWVNALQAEPRAKLLTAMQRGERDDVVLATLRSPVPLGEPFKSVATDRWQQRCRTDDAKEAEYLAGFTRSLSWGEKTLAHILAATNSALRPDESQLKRVRDQLANVKTVVAAAARAGAVA